MPASACVSPRRTRIRVVFPAPLGPRHPNAHPRGTRSSTSLTAMFGPKCLVSPCVSTAHPSLELPCRTIEGAGGEPCTVPLSRRACLFPMGSPGGRPASATIGFARRLNLWRPRSEPVVPVSPGDKAKHSVGECRENEQSQDAHDLSRVRIVRGALAVAFARSNEHRAEVGLPGGRNAGHSSGRDLSQLNVGQLGVRGELPEPPR